ncbi:MAG: methyltransferase domain-containing protein [Chloroflexi bacterium]|nr:methyltransferase domain-containing protein [Chloroflexota bacterium]
MALLERLLRAFFHHFYHRLAWSYDLVAAVVSLGRWNDWGRETLRFIDGPTVLELGHGPGHLQLALLQGGFQALGLDESPQMLRQASRRLRRRAMPASLARSRAECLPFGQVFNSIVAAFPTEYILAPATLAEAWRVLFPGGRLVVLAGAWIGGGTLPERAARLLFRITGQGREITRLVTERFKVPFERAGFEVEVRIEECSHSALFFLLACKPSDSTRHHCSKIKTWRSRSL